MGGLIVNVIFVAVMIAVIVGLDLAFFRGHFWARLIVNAGVVLIFAAFWLRFRGSLGPPS